MRWVWISTGLHIKNVDVNGNFVRVRLVLELVAGNLVLVGFFSGLWVLY